MNLSGNTYWDIWELREILPSPGYPNDKVNILLSGMVPLIWTHMESRSKNISSMDQIHQQIGVPLKGCSLLIVLKEAYIP
jgi:hypothetical protein